MLNKNLILLIMLEVIKMTKRRNGPVTQIWLCCLAMVMSLPVHAEKIALVGGRLIDGNGCTAYVTQCHFD